MRANKILFIAATCVLIGLLLSSFALAEDAASVKLSYRIESSVAKDSVLSLLVSLRAQNISKEPIYEVMASVVTENNMIANAETIHIGNINIGETVLSNETFAITTANNMSQNRAGGSIVWRVEYKNSRGEHVIENVQL